MIFFKKRGQKSPFAVFLLLGSDFPFAPLDFFLARKKESVSLSDHVYEGLVLRKQSG